MTAPWSLFGRPNVLTADNKYACHVVFHIGLSGVFELHSSAWMTVVLDKLMASLPVSK
jgi:hypothetical protein